MTLLRMEPWNHLGWKRTLRVQPSPALGHSPTSPGATSRCPLKPPAPFSAHEHGPEAVFGSVSIVQLIFTLFPALRAGLGLAHGLSMWDPPGNAQGSSPCISLPGGSSGHLSTGTRGHRSCLPGLGHQQRDIPGLCCLPAFPHPRHCLCLLGAEPPGVAQRPLIGSKLVPKAIPAILGSPRASYWHCFSAVATSRAQTPCVLWPLALGVVGNHDSLEGQSPELLPRCSCKCGLG